MGDFADSIELNDFNDSAASASAELNNFNDSVFLRLVNYSY